MMITIITDVALRMVLIWKSESVVFYRIAKIFIDPMGLGKN